MSQTFSSPAAPGSSGRTSPRPLLERGTACSCSTTCRRVPLDNLRVRDHPRLRLEVGSVLDELRVDELVHRCDVVVHLAAAVGVKLIIEEPLRSFTTNIRGSEIVIGAAHRYRRKILIASTSEVYGKNGADKLTETSDRILGPTSISRWSYSTAKAVDEILAFNYHRERGLQAVIVRLFNTVGPRQSPGYGMVIPRLARQAVVGEPLTVFGDGRRAVASATSTTWSGPHRADRRAGGDRQRVQRRRHGEISILELAERVIERRQLVTVDLIPYEDAYAEGFEDMRRRVPDTTKMQELTGWGPRRTLDDVLDDAIAYARRELRLEAACSTSWPRSRKT